MLIALVVIVVCSFATMIYMALVLNARTVDGWQVALNALQGVTRNQTARITTLENRLLSHDWQDFANLQMVPDETAKSSWNGNVEQGHFSDEDISRAMAEARNRLDGVDLEPDQFEGPTIG